MKRNLILVGSVLLSFVWAGAWWARQGPVFAARPLPPLTDLLIQISDVPDCGLGCEEVERGAELAKEMAEFIGLPLDYPEGTGVYLMVYTVPHFKGVVESLYRYPSEEEARAHYERLVETLPFASLNREPDRILSQSEWSFKGIKGRIIEVQDPAGTVYCFFGFSGRLLITLGMLNVDLNFSDDSGQQFFKELLSIAVERIVKPPFTKQSSLES